MTHQRSGLHSIIALLGALALAGCDAPDSGGTDQETAQQEETRQAPADGNSSASNQQQTAAESEWTEPEATSEPACPDCGTVTAVEPVAKKGESSGIGMVAGGVAGGIIGNQIGGGTGKKIATVAGAVGGAFAGNEVEKYTNAEKYYAVSVEMDNGGTQTAKIANGDAISVGDKVRVDGNNLYLQ
ncbi:outer membrane lipoprotein SlyB [Methylohalomonas lacus]|uniref:Outer membrane lipoprotein SlyB n=1 Tax=Methylohalomonas lacus TaxID=398773 RepID=A0AAE3HJD4_9GAMM|nr:glycine zipper 2TM domain-containing protein [Methylohalomonas lacus]MCS3903454.1 outer membrane lipoprotein SlyB [Methylohalomonas lacus]